MHHQQTPPDPHLHPYFRPYITSSFITFNGEGGVEAGWCLLLAVVVMVGRRKYGVIAALLVRKYR